MIEDRVIRKISVGFDITRQLHVSTKSRIAGNIVAAILKVAANEYEVWVEIDDSKSTCVWKTFVNMPVIVEYDTKLK